MMRVTLPLLVLLGCQPVLASDRAPKLNVEALCKTTTATDKAMGLVLAQSFSACMRDENAAQKQLISLWQKNPGSVRDECEGEAMAGGIQSYVDLLTCMQMADWAKPASQATRLRGASKNRNTN
jgi:hypothetical protein